MKIKTKFSHRIIAVFFTLNFIQTLIPYNQLWANNNGPKSPEAAAFESVDATDMVNLLTGDMSYVMPLLTVPSPEGGYPIALSYHGGVAVNQEASWVGLGWTLNPGAINRNLNKIPDDWNQVKTYNVVHDSGGVLTNFRGSVNFGISGVATTGEYISYSEQRAFNGQNRFNSRLDTGRQESHLGTNISYGTDGVSIGIGIGVAQVSLRQSFITGEATVGVNIPGIGVSLNSDGLDVSVAGKSIGLNTENTGARSLNFSTQSFNISIPAPFVRVDLSYSRARYSFYERDYTINQGTLYLGDTKQVYDDNNFLQKIDFDNQESFNTINRESELTRGNYTTLSYDDYSVSGQGISGIMNPKILEQGYAYNKETSVGGYGNFIVGEYPNELVDYNKKIDGVEENKMHFYLSNEYSSYLNITSDLWDTNINNPTDIFDYLTLNNSFNDVLYGQDTYNEQTGRMKKGNYIETYTNKELIENPNKILTPNDFVRNTDEVPEDGIGAFKITSLDGKTYHYSIPVYQREKISRVTKVDENIETVFSENQQLEPYATHWLLTGVTGPDYVDVDGDNKLSEGDYGYWVAFEYGKWSNGYTWRTPHEGVKEFDRIKSYNWGAKDIYYLDKIKTRTHTALFIKEERRDDYSTPINIPNGPTGTQWFQDVHFRSQVQGKDGNVYVSGVYDAIRPITHMNSTDVIKTSHGTSFHVKEHKSLRLNKIVVLKNENPYSEIQKTHPNEPLVKNLGSLEVIENYQTYVLQGIPQSGQIFRYRRELKGEFYGNVLDIGDVNAMAPNIINNAIKTIQFNYDENYPLAKNTPNSKSLSKGKLTLKSVQNIGRDGVQTIPPYKFTYYDQNVSFNEDQNDSWGFYKNNPDVWSLKTIQTPTGGLIEVEYEPDTYHKEVAETNRVLREDLKFGFRESSAYGKYLEVINIDNPIHRIDFRKFFEIGKLAYIDVLHWRHPNGNKAHRIGDVAGEVNVISVTEDKVVFDLPDFNIHPTVRRGKSCFNEEWVYYKTYHKLITEWHEKIDEKNCEDPRDTSNGTRSRYSFYSNKKLYNNGDNEGGGLRVKSIAIINETNEKYKTGYKYNDPNTGKTSGVTLYAPVEYTKNVDFVTELPAPNVMYEYVRVENYSLDDRLTGYNEYKFKVPKNINYTNRGFELDDLISLTLKQNKDISDINLQLGGRVQNVDVNFSKHELIDNTSAMGSLLYNKTFNAKGQLMYATENVYKSSSDNLQGTLGETYKNTKIHINNDQQKKYYVNSSNKIRKQNVLKEQRITQGGFTKVSINEKYDILSGVPIEILSESSDGNIYKEKTTPAYHILEYSGLGSKTDNPLNKNMLTQESISITEVKRGIDVWDKISANITTWSNQWEYVNADGTIENPVDEKEKIWRKHKDYIWKGTTNADGVYIGYIGEDDGFDWSLNVDQSNTKWLNTSTTNKYNHYSSPIETVDVNNNQASRKYGDEDSKIFAVANAGYNEMFYSGAEDLISGNQFSGQVKKGGQAAVVTTAHTGKYALNVPTKNIIFIVKPKTGKRYKASVWVLKNGENYKTTRLTVDGYRIGYHPKELVFAGDWVQMNFYTDEVMTNQDVYLINISNDGIYDDFRILPLESTMTSYVYNERDELTEVLGANNLATKYEYDKTGRLIKTYQEVIDAPTFQGGMKLINTYEYTYQSN